MDGTVIKKVIKNGFITSKPEVLSRLYFDYSISINKEEIYTTFKKNINYQPADSDEQFIQNKTNFDYITEYRLSKALDKTLQSMKKFEVSIMDIKDLKRLKYGSDYERIKSYLASKELELNGEFLTNNKITYRIKLYFFTEGKNSFTVKIDEKIEYICRRKQKAVAFIKSGHYKRSVKLLKKIKALCNFGTFDEDKLKLRNFKISANLNLSLCYWKLCDWKKMIQSAEDVLSDDPQNTKAVYRVAFAYNELEEFRKGIDALKQSNLEQTKPLENMMIRLRKNLRKINAKEKKLFSKLFKQNK